MMEQKDLEKKVDDAIANLGLTEESLQYNIVKEFELYSKKYKNYNIVLGALVYWLAPEIGKRRTLKQIGDSLGVSETTVRR